MAWEELLPKEPCMLDILDRGIFLNIEKIKTELENHLGKEATLKYHLGRNKYEEYHVTIKEAYNRVFLVELKNKDHQIKSFSYSDIITKTIKIKY